MAKRRSNGEGSIRKRKDGRWEGRYTAGFDPTTGKQVFKNVLGKTQNEVKEKLKKALEESQKLDYTRTGKYTVSQWMEEWFENVCKIKVRPSSHQTYRGSTTSATPLPPSPCRMAWTSRPYPASSVTSPQGLLWTPMPMSPPPHKKKQP